MDATARVHGSARQRGGMASGGVRTSARGFRAVRVDNAFERLLHATSKSIHAPTRRSSMRACPPGVIFENPRFSFCSMSTCEFSTRLLCWTWQPRCAGRWARPAKRAHGEIQCRSIDNPTRARSMHADASIKTASIDTSQLSSGHFWRSFSYLFSIATASFRGIDLRQKLRIPDPGTKHRSISHSRLGRAS